MSTNFMWKKGKDFIIYGIGQAFNLLTPLLITPYLISKSGLENFGKISLGLALSFFVIVIIDFGVDILGVKDVSIHRHSREQLQKIINITYSSRLVLLIIVLMLLSLVFLFLPSIANEKKLFFLGMPILVGQYINPTWFLQGLEKFKTVTVLNISSKIIYLTCVFIFIKTPSDYVYANFFWGLGMIISYGIGLLFCIKTLHLKINRKVTFTEVSNYLKNGYKFCISQLFLSFKYYSPIAIVSIISGYNLAGFYRVIDQIVSIFRTYLQVFFRFFYPNICYKMSHDQKQGFLYWKKVNSTNFIFIALLLLIFSVNSDFILNFFKLSSQDIQSISTVFKFSLIIPLTISLNYALEQLFFCLEKKEQYIKITIVSVLFNTAIIVVLFYNFQLLGLVIGLLITEILLITTYLFVLNKLFKKGI